MFLGGCKPEPELVEPEAHVDPPARSAAALSPRTAHLFQRSCGLCHVDGNAGAPRVGRVEEWSERLKQGPDKLLKHTVEGLNSMPPLGYCMACERDDFVSLIEFMTAQNVGGKR